MIKNVAVFGGSFDMPTLGHVMVTIHILLNEPDTDLILVVPCFDHVEKPNLLPFYHRFEMCNRAFSTLPNVQVSPIEAEIGGPSYTYLMLQNLQKQHPEWKLKFVLGSDLKDSAKSWEGWSEVERIAPPLLIGRAGIPTEGGPSPISPPCSSTMVRTLLAEGNYTAAARFVPKRVLEYIQFHQLYLHRKKMTYDKWIEDVIFWLGIDTLTPTQIEARLGREVCMTAFNDGDPASNFADKNEVEFGIVLVSSY